MPFDIPKQPETEWFNTLANTPAVATPLETLEWLCVPDSPSLGKRAYDLDTGLTSLVYGPAEYDTSTSPESPMTGLMVLSGLNGQDDPEDCKAKKAWI